MTLRLMTILAIGAVSMSAAHADDSTFASLDKDGNGGVSLAEMQAVATYMTAEEFAEYDADGSGELSKEEFANWMNASKSQ